MAGDRLMSETVFSSAAFPTPLLGLQDLLRSEAEARSKHIIKYVLHKKACLHTCMVRAVKCTSRSTKKVCLSPIQWGMGSLLVMPIFISQ